jgi:hypothetical protein
VICLMFTGWFSMGCSSYTWYEPCKIFDVQHFLLLILGRVIWNSLYIFAMPKATVFKTITLGFVYHLSLLKLLHFGKRNYFQNIVVLINSDNGWSPNLNNVSCQGWPNVLNIRAAYDNFQKFRSHKQMWTGWRKCSCTCFPHS